MIRAEDVFAIADRLHAAGRKVTIETVREQLGTGSNSTIGRHLRDWRERLQAEAADRLVERQMPEELLAEMDAFWQHAVERARGLFREAEEALQVQRAAALAERDAAREEAAAALAGTDRLQISLTRLQAEQRQLTRQLTVLRQQRARDQQRLGELAAAHQQRLGELQQRARAAERELVRAHQTHTRALAAERERAEAESNRLLQLLDDVRQAAANLHHQLDAQRRAREHAETELQQRTSERDEARAAAERSGRQLAELTGRYTQTSRTLDQREAELANRHERELAQSQELEHRAAEIRRLEGELEALRTTLAQRRRRNSAENGSERSPVTPSLFVRDLLRTVHFYVEVLGFQQTGSYRDDDQSEIWAEVTLGEARIWFFSHALDKQLVSAFSGLIYLFVGDVDALAARLEGRVPFEWGPETQEYGLRELGIRDVNGYYLVFAQSILSIGSAYR